MNFILSHFRKLDWILIIAVMLLVGIGMVSIYSSSLHAGDFGNLKKQGIFFVAGLAAMFILSFFDWRIFRENSYLILGLYFFSLLALVGVYFFGADLRGVRTWYKIGQVTIDPIESIKPVLVIMLAKYFSSRHVAMYQIRHLLLSGFYVFLPAALIFFQPNLGACLILLAFWIGMLIISGIKMKHFLLLILCFAITLALGWSFFLKDYQKARIMSFFVPYDPLGVSWSQNQSKIAVAVGGLAGLGIGNGSQTQYGFLSEPQTDFIFSAVAEEAGLMGIAAILMLFLLVLWRVTLIAQNAHDNFAQLLAAGFCVLLAAEVFVHVAVNIGLLPIIGLPLPFVSYGGSNLIASFAMLGILQSIRTNPYHEI